MFQLQKLSNFGTSTPAVARTLVQGADLLEFFRATDAQRDGCKTVLLELQRHLLKCVDVHERISAAVQGELKAVADRGAGFQRGSPVLSLPGVADLQSDAETFLQSVKLAIREPARLIEPLCGGSHGHRFDKLGTWAEAQWGIDDAFSKTIRQWEPWVKTVIELRNAVDHPSEKDGGTLVVHNFRLIEVNESLSLVEPTWNLSGREPTLICAGMAAIIEGVIVLGEHILIGLFEKFKQHGMLVVAEIPVNERDPACPKRFRVCLDGTPPTA